MAILRCWLIRGLILAVLVGGGGFAVGLSSRASPEQVRAALIAELEGQFADTDVHVGAARLRLFGGVVVSDLRLTRRGDPEPFFAAPAAVIFHEKQTLHRGRLEIRKIELDAPTLRLVRRADGMWNVSGIAKPGPADSPIPTVVVRNATVFVADARPGGPPPVVASCVRLTLVNDPTPVLTANLQAVIAPVPADGGEPGLHVPTSVTVRLYRPTGHTTARVELPDIAFAPDLAPVLAKIDPNVVTYAERFSGRLSLRADLVADPNGPDPLRYDLRVGVREGRFEDHDLPWPIEHIAGEIHVRDGKVTVDQVAARIGPAAVELALETRAAATARPEGEGLDALQAHLERLDLTLRDMPLNDDLFAKLPEKASKARRMFGPTGGLDASLRFTRTGPAWKRELELRPNRLGIVYEKFPYPVTDLSGQVVQVVASDGTDEFRVDLTGTAGGRRIEATGTVSGDGPDPKINLRLAGTDLPIDEQLLGALPPKSARALRKLRATGRGDFVADIRQEHWVNRCDNTFRVRVYGGSVNYSHFPYPISEVKGDITIYASATDEDRPLRPGLPLTPLEDLDRIRLRNFEGTHGGGRIWLSGENDPIPGTPDRKMTLRVQGLDCPADADLRTALAEVNLGEVVETFQPRGSITFGADLEIIDRNGSVPEKDDSPDLLVSNPIAPAAALLPAEPPFDPVADLRMTLNFKNLGITPDFFPYPFDDLGGVLRYRGGRLDLTRFSARHGNSRWGLDAGEVRFADNGEIWANLGRLTASPLIPDAEFVNALPGKLRDGMKELNVRGPLELVMNHLVVKMPAPQTGSGGGGVGEGVIVHTSTLDPTHPPTASDPIVYWNGEVRLSGAGLDAGVPWEDLYGVVATTGRYEGTHLGPVAGNAWLDKATVAKQPITAGKLSYRVRAQQQDPARPGAFTPPVLEIPDVAGTLFQGTIGGEARVEFTDDTKYRVWLTASDARLEDLAAHLGLGSGAELSGRAQAKLLIETATDPETGRAVTIGAGQVDVPNGRMYNLPVLLPLLKLLKLQAPDQTAFEEAHATFDLRGDRVTFSQLDLIGTAVSLGGSGVVDTDGESARFEFYPVLSQALKKWLTGPNGTDLTAFLSGSLFKIEVTRRDGQTDYTAHMLPAVTEPLRAVADRLRARLGRLPEPPPTARATIQR